MSLSRKSLLSIAITLSGFLFHAAVIADSKKLPFPFLPISFEESIYKGEKGCLADNKNSTWTRSGIAYNEGMELIGTGPLIQTTQDGIHAMSVYYSKSKDYGYLLTNKGDGKVCVSEKLSRFSIHKTGDFKILNLEKLHSKEDCNFTQRYGKPCGTFNHLSGALLSKGFRIDFQGVNKKGFIYTFLSGNGSGNAKIYRLTTHPQTGATVITGNGTEEFVFHDKSKKAADT